MRNKAIISHPDPSAFRRGLSRPRRQIGIYIPCISAPSRQSCGLRHSTDGRLGIAFRRQDGFGRICAGGKGRKPRGKTGPTRKSRRHVV